MRPLALAVALGGIGALVVAAPLLRARVSPPVERLPAPAAAAEAELELSAVPVPFVVRPVAPEVVAPPPVEQRALKRIDAREPLSPIGRAHVPSEGPPKETVLHRPLVTQAGVFAAMGYHVVLAGLRPTPVDETCMSDGVSWPCGIHARTAFRNWLRGRALACVVPPAPPREALTVSCRLGKLDAGEWLVAHGWADADPADEHYAVPARAAREAGLGLYGPAPAAAAPFTVTVPEPGDAGLTESGVLEADPAGPAASGG